MEPLGGDVDPVSEPSESDGAVRNLKEPSPDFGL